MLQENLYLEEDESAELHEREKKEGPSRAEKLHQRMLLIKFEVYTTRFEEKGVCFYQLRGRKTTSEMLLSNIGVYTNSFRGNNLLSSTV